MSITRGAAALLALSAAPVWGQENAPQGPADAGWRIAPAAHTDLWFHAMAVIGADEPGPLGLYSAEYAAVVLEAKRDAGVYPTPLDREGAQLRRQLGDSAVQSLHFLPLYFSGATPETMLEEVGLAVSRGSRPVGMAGGGELGRLVVMQMAQDRAARRLIERLVDLVEREWNLFYRDYWEREHAARADVYDAMQVLWDSTLARPLQHFLERRRLTGGRVMPSPPVGPEGRIVDESEIVPDDQVVAVQFPPSAVGPDVAVFAFLKELCFLVIEDRTLRRAAPDERDLEDLRRRAAVRCGDVILRFHAPLLAAGYRRVFLDAVGAEKSYTVGAFERVFPLPPPVYEMVHEAVRQP